MATDTPALSDIGAVPTPARRRPRIDNRFLPPLLITSILLTAHLSFGILEGWERTALAIADGHRRRAGHGPCHLRRLAASGERLHQRHQRRHPGAVAVRVALRPDQPDLDHLEVRAALPRPAPLEPVELRRQRRGLPGAGDGRGAQHPVGQRGRADGRDLAARARSSSGGSAGCTSRRPTWRRSCCSRWCAPR